MANMRKSEVVHEHFGGYTRKLEVVHKEVGGCLIPYNLQLACVRKYEVSDQIGVHRRVDHSEKQNVNYSSQSVRPIYVGVELLGQQNMLFPGTKALKVHLSNIRRCSFCLLL